MEGDFCYNLGAYTRIGIEVCLIGLAYILGRGRGGTLGRREARKWDFNEEQG
jgi:hypothetical protein